MKIEINTENETKAHLEHLANMLLAIAGKKDESISNNSSEGAIVSNTSNEGFFNIFGDDSVSQMQSEGVQNSLTEQNSLAEQNSSEKAQPQSMFNMFNDNSESIAEINSLESIPVIEKKEELSEPKLEFY